MHIHPSSPNSSCSPTLFQSEESAAIKIQSRFRGYRVRKQLHHHQSRSSNGNVYKSSSYRAQQRKRQVMENPKGATTSIASLNLNERSSVAAPLLNDPGMGEGATIEDRCATKIQAGVRGFLVRKKQKIATDAATKIQAGFRGFKARKETQKMKEN